MTSTVQADDHLKETKGKADFQITQILVRNDNFINIEIETAGGMCEDL